MPQRDSLCADLTVGQQLKLWQAACGSRGLPKQTAELMGVTSLLRSPISQLSGGMRQRVSIAMALLQQPQILVMDEATVGLDERYVQALMAWLEDFLSEGEPCLVYPPAGGIGAAVWPLPAVKRGKGPVGRP